jgi:hypothetical protein
MTSPPSPRSGKYRLTLKELDARLKRSDWFIRQMYVRLHLLEKGPIHQSRGCFYCESVKP